MCSPLLVYCTTLLSHRNRMLCSDLTPCSVWDNTPSAAKQHTLCSKRWLCFEVNSPHVMTSPHAQNSTANPLEQKMAMNCSSSICCSGLYMQPT